MRTPVIISAVRENTYFAEDVTLQIGGALPEAAGGGVCARVSGAASASPMASRAVG